MLVCLVSDNVQFAQLNGFFPPNRKLVLIKFTVVDLMGGEEGKCSSVPHGNLRNWPRFKKKKISFENFIQKGWIKTFSGMRSLISLVLILWYFWIPFNRYSWRITSKKFFPFYEELPPGIKVIYWLPSSLVFQAFSFKSSTNSLYNDLLNRWNFNT